MNNLRSLWRLVLPRQSFRLEFDPYPKVLLLGIVILASQSAFSQTESGTVVIVGYSHNKIVIAADSRRVSQKDGGYLDDSCKVTALDDKSIFSAVGKAQSTGVDNAVEWDAAREARASFVNSPHLQTDDPGDFLNRVTGEWGRIMGTELVQHAQSIGIDAMVDGQEVITGIFAGTNETGALHLSIQVIAIKKPPNGPEGLFIPRPRVVTITDAFQVKPLGESDVFYEFTNSKTKRSKRWATTLAKDGRQSKDRDALKVIRLVELTRDYGADTVTVGNVTVRIVGGDTDAAELNLGEKVQWIQRKSACQ